MIMTRLALSLITLALVAGCKAEVVCSSEITDGTGMWKGQASGRKPKIDVRREAVRDACAKLCAEKGTPNDACTSRCAVDVDAAKIGAKIACSGGKR